MSEDQAKANADRELWRESDDFYADSIHVTKAGGIGINIGGHVIVRSLTQWHAAITEYERLKAEIARLRSENEGIGRRLGLLNGDLDAQRLLVHEARVRFDDADREIERLRAENSGWKRLVNDAERALGMNSVASSPEARSLVEWCDEARIIAAADTQHRGLSSRAAQRSDCRPDERDMI